MMSVYQDELAPVILCLGILVCVCMYIYIYMCVYIYILQHIMCRVPYMFLFQFSLTGMCPIPVHV